MEKYTLKQHKITQISLVILLIFSLTLCFPLSVLAEDVVPNDIEDQMDGYEWTDEAKEDVWTIFGVTSWSTVDEAASMISENDGSMAYFTTDTMGNYSNVERYYEDIVTTKLESMAKSTTYDNMAYSGIIIYCMYKMFYYLYDYCQYDGIIIDVNESGKFYMKDSNGNIVDTNNPVTINGMTITDVPEYALYVFFGVTGTIYRSENSSISLLVEKIYQRIARYEIHEIVEEDSVTVDFADIYIKSPTLVVMVTSIFLPNFYTYYYDNNLSYNEEDWTSDYSSFGSILTNNYATSTEYTNDDVYKFKTAYDSYDVSKFCEINLDIYNNYVAIKSDGHVIWAY